MTSKDAEYLAWPERRRHQTASSSTGCNKMWSNLHLHLLIFLKFDEDTYFATASRHQLKRVALGQIYQALTPQLAAALPGFYSFTGADIMSSFASKGKFAFWKMLGRQWRQCDSFHRLGTTAMLLVILVQFNYSWGYFHVTIYRCFGSLCLWYWVVG